MTQEPVTVEGEVQIETPTTPQITDEMIEQYLSTKSVDDMKKIPSFNQHTQRVLTDQDRKTRQKFQQEQQREQEFKQADVYFQNLSLDPEQFQEQMKNPQIAEAYRQVLDYRSSHNAQYTEWTKRQVNGLYSQVKEREDFKEIDLDEVLADSPGPIDFILKLSDKVGSKRAAKMYESDIKGIEDRFEKRLKEEVAAAINAARLKEYGETTTPSTPEAPQVGGSSNDADDTAIVAQAMGLSIDAVRKLLKEK